MVRKGELMAYFSKQFTQEVVLPDGTTASSIPQIERFLKKNHWALALDYSDEFRAQVRYRQEKNERKELFRTFLKNYKRLIWTQK